MNQTIKHNGATPNTGNPSCSTPPTLIRPLIVATAAILAALFATTTLASAQAVNEDIQAVDDRAPSAGSQEQGGISMYAFSRRSSGYRVAEDRRLRVGSKRGVLANDRGSGKLRAKMARRTRHGSIMLRRNGGFVYKPRSNYYGNDSFRYRACNGGGCSRPATAYIRVTPVNDAPVARDNILSVTEDHKLTLADPGIMANDYDIDTAKSSLSATVATSTTNGTLALNKGGGLTYTPRTNFSGTDRFVYRLSDGRAADTATTTISVTAVNDPPSPSNDVFDGRKNSTRTVSSPGVLKNDSDPDGDPLRVVGYTQPSKARIKMWPNGAVRFDPARDFRGRTEFKYTVSDGHGNNRQATVTLRIGL